MTHMFSLAVGLSVLLILGEGQMLRLFFERGRDRSIYTECRATAGGCSALRLRL